MVILTSGVVGRQAGGHERFSLKEGAKPQVDRLDRQAGGREGSLHFQVEQIRRTDDVLCNCNAAAAAPAAAARADKAEGVFEAEE